MKYEISVDKFQTKHYLTQSQRKHLNKCNVELLIKIVFLVLI